VLRDRPVRSNTIGSLRIFLGIPLPNALRTSPVEFTDELAVTTFTSIAATV